MNVSSILGPTIGVFLGILVVLSPFILIGFVLMVRNRPAENGISEEKGKRLYNYRRKQFFMTRNEHECYKALVQVVGDQYFIFAQVHLPTIVDEKIQGQDWRAARAHINRKSVDFVLCDKEYISPKLAIELDDWSHARTDRQERDGEVERLLAQAGIPLLRITDTRDLTEKIIKAVSYGTARI